MLSLVLEIPLSCNQDVGQEEILAWGFVPNRGRRSPFLPFMCGSGDIEQNKSFGYGVK